MEIKNSIISETLAHIFSAGAGAVNVVPPAPPTVGDIQPIRLLFLDVDGVLNSHKTQVVYGATPDVGYDSEKGYVENAFATDRMAAELINKVCEMTGTYIVLSSAWRVGSTLAQVRIMLETLGINPKYVIGMTDTLNAHRGNQVERFVKCIATLDGRNWLKKCGLVDEDLELAEKVYVESYAIIDDEDKFNENQKPCFVQTTFMEGLTLTLAIELGKILSNDETFYLNALKGLPSFGAAGEAKFH